MPRTCSRDFQKAAKQRFNAAEALFNADFTLDAQYIGGYVVECSLKALILELTAENERSETLARITSGATMHKPETLLGELKKFGIQLPLEFARRMRRFDWSTDLRYETGRCSRSETKGLLKTCTAILKWVEGQLP